jgi:glycosyltransferase involved in cell wall biosynthesis
MTSIPRVSVLLVVYEPHPLYFRQAVYSILQQTFSDWELIIVEDPSPISGQELLRDFCDPRIRYFRNARRTSLIAQRNQSLAMARAELVAIQDADDVSLPQRLEQQVTYLQEHPEIGVVGSQIAILDAQGIVRGYRFFPQEPEQIRRALPRYLPLSQPSALFRKHLLEEVGGYQAVQRSLLGAEDYDLLSRLVQHGVRCANLPEVLLLYRLHAGQLKARRLRDIIRGTISVKRRYWGKQQDGLGRLQLAAETLLLTLPASLVYPLLVQLYYRRSPPAGLSLSLPFWLSGSCLPLQTARPPVSRAVKFL